MDVRILEVARHGVVTLEELRALGLGQDAVDYRARSGKLHRRYTGVFAVGRPDLRLEGEFLAAVLACGPSAVLSHRSAARLWGLRGGGTHRIDVTAPRGVRPKPGLRIHRPLLPLDAIDKIERDGVPVTAVARTLLDCADPRARVDVGRLLHEASVQEVLDAREVWNVLARCPGAPGARALERAMREELPPFTRSGLEREVVRLLRDARLPKPRVNAHVWVGDELLEVDFFWPDLGVIVETDGSRYHSTRWRRRKDAEKTARLVAAGYTVVRVTDVEVAGTPEAVVARIAATLGLRNP
jgi:very-short-patch-repair endonuclease